MITKADVIKYCKDNGLILVPRESIKTLQCTETVSNRDLMTAPDHVRELVRGAMTRAVAREIENANMLALSVVQKFCR